MLAPLIPVMYLDTTVDHMLKGLGEQFYSMVVNIADSFLSVLLVLFLLPKFGIVGYIMTIYISELINASLSAVRLIKKSGFKTHFSKWITKPLLCIIGSTCIAHILFSFIALASLPSALRLTVHIVSTVIVYTLLLMATNAFDKEDIRWLMRIFQKSSQ